MADQGPDWNIEDVCGDPIGIYAANEGRAVGVEIDERAWLDLPRLRALIAELTRRAALLAGEAGEASARPEIPAWVRSGLDELLVSAETRTPEQQAQIDKATAWIVEHAAWKSEAPARTAEDERADVVAWLRLVDGFVINTTGAADRVANGCHVGFAGLADSGPGYYAGRDDHGRQVVVHADTPAGLARVSAAAGVASWSGPHPSLGAAGKALDAEGGQ